MNFLKSIVKEIDNEYASIVSDGVSAGDCDSFIDTGCYLFNALVSGSIRGGIPANKITAIAGESSTGKTFFVLSIVKSFLDNHPEAGVIYFESESAITKQMIEERGIDSSRMIIVPVTTAAPTHNCPSNKPISSPASKSIPSIVADVIFIPIEL